MTHCQRAVIRMLEAEPADLRGEGDPALAAHLAACATCRGAARRILEEHDMLAEAMAAVRPRRPVEEALGHARLEAQRRRRRFWLGAAPALAAAGIAGLLVAWPSRSAVEPVAEASELEPPPPLVESSTADGVTIMQTENPNIVVVWLTKSRSES